VLVLVGWYMFGAESNTSASNAAGSKNLSVRTGSATSTASGPAIVGTNGGPYSAAGLQSRQEQLALWRGRYERAEQTYASYRDATRYPYDSRPIVEHPDQVRPFAPISEELKMRNANGDVVEGIRLRTSQERVFLSGKESVKFRR
jgi:hypothetical protein